MFNMTSDIIINGKFEGKDIDFNDFMSKLNLFLSANNVSFEGTIYFNEYIEAEIIE